MANTKISALTDGTTAQATDAIHVARSGANYYITPSYIKTYLGIAGTLSVASGKTFTASNTLTLAGTDSTTMTFPSTSATIARTDAGQTFTGNQTIDSGSLILSGNISSAAWTTSGIRYKSVAATLTDTTSTGTVAAAYTNVYGGNTIAASNAATFTDYFTTFITQPTAGTNVTFTNRWALGTTGSVLCGGPTLRLGAADAASPVAQTLQVQSVVAGTTNTLGADFTIKGSLGTGDKAGGSIIFQVAPAGSSGTSQNALATALTINGDTTSTFTNTIFVKYGGNTKLQIWPSLSCGLVLASDQSFAWSNSTSASTAYDLILNRDAANTLALRNSTNPQLFRVYSTYTNNTTNAFGGIGAAINLDGTAGDANTLYIGSQKTGSPTALTKLALQVDGTTRCDYGVTTAGTWTFQAPGQSNGYSAVDFKTTGTGQFGFNTVTQMFAPSTSNATMVVFQYGVASTTNNSAGLGFYYVSSGSSSNYLSFSINGSNELFNIKPSGIVSFGGWTSSFPALKRSSATLQVRLADDSAFAAVQGKLTTDTNATAGTITADKYLVLYDAAGTAYKVPCVAV